MIVDAVKIIKIFQDEINNVNSDSDLEKLRIKYLGRKAGIITRFTQDIPKLGPNKRIDIGTKIKKIKSFIEQEINKKKSDLETRVSTETIDITIPGKKLDVGSLHPLTQVIEDIKEIFCYLGFTWVDGPEAESDLYNFQKLNMPPDHPARDVQQTYYISKNILLRTHTSNMQVRYMESHKPPIRVLFPGRCYRRDMPDATHLPSFYQIEGLLVDEKSTMTDLLGTLDFFAKNFFGEEAKIRVYGHHFPYTEPSIEVEVLHPKKGWIEILGAGMVHPNVLKNGNIDPNKYKGWAFGMGPDRLAMLKYGISDIRTFFKNDLRFLNQF